MEKLGELERLARLRESGALTEEEFAREKSRLLTPPPQRRALMFSGAILSVVLIAALGALALLKSKPAQPTNGPTTPAAPTASTLQTSTAAPLPEAPVQVSKLQQLFRRDMLGAQLQYLEASTGPARNVEGNDRTYLVDGCEVAVHAEGRSIKSIGLRHISPKCNVSLRAFGLDAMTDKITFGMVEAVGISGETQYSADCVSYCGNAFDPFVYAHVSTPHVNDFIEFRPGANIEVEPMLSATLKWSDVMKSTKGEDYVAQTQFNCDRTFNAMASRLFHNIKIDSIEVGSFPSCYQRPPT
jgi:Short C-terminal domain